MIFDFFYRLGRNHIAPSLLYRYQKESDIIVYLIYFFYFHIIFIVKRVLNYHTAIFT